MSHLRAGFGRVDVTPKLGCKLVGYGGRDQGATGVHDPLQARALVLEDDGGRFAIIAVEFLYVNIDTAQIIRQAIEQRVGIPPANVFISTIHTHAGPHDKHTDNWSRPLPEIIADAVEAAGNSLQPARIGGGYGYLYGYSINRRYIDRPVDPGVAVFRIDDAAGKPLGLITNFACHAVVMGYDNFQLSGDWPGYACRKLEAELGPGSTVMFLQGGAGNVNPLVEGVRKHLRSGQPVIAIGDISVYYGKQSDPNAWNIGDRGGGTFEEVAELGEAFAAEAIHVARHIETKVPSTPLWSAQAVIDATAEPNEPHFQPPALSLSLVTEKPTSAGERKISAEIMVLQAGDMVLVGEPGEAFSETGVDIKAVLRRMGYVTPMFVTYANGWLAYLPEPEAFDEGGYEPGWPIRLGISRNFQGRAWKAIEPIIRQHAPAKA